MPDPLATATKVETDPLAGAMALAPDPLTGAVAVPASTFLARVNEFLQPTATWLGRVTGRLAESGEAVESLPGMAYRYATGQAQPGQPASVTGMDLIRTGLKALGAPFEPIFAPFGEAVRTAAEPYLGEKGGATAGAVSEMALGVALPFVRVPSTPTMRGLTKVGIGRLPEEAVATERGAAGLSPIIVQEQSASISRGLKASEPLAEAAGKAEAVPIIRSGREVPKPLVTEETALRIEDSLGQKIPPVLQGTRLSTDTTRKVVAAAEDAFTKMGIPRDADVPITLQVVEMMSEKPEAFKTLKASLETSGATLDDLAQMFMTTASDAGRQLGQLGNLEKRLQGIPELADLATALGKAKEPLSGWELAGHFWGRFVNLWRGSLVTALSTAMRNLETQMVRVAIDPIEKSVDGTIRTLFRLGPETERGMTPAFRSAMETMGSLVSKGKRAQVDEIIKAFPDEADQLFYRYASDVARSTKGAKIEGSVATRIESTMTKAESAVNFFNTINRGQEFLVRRVAFRVKLAEDLAKRGVDIDRILPGQVKAEEVAAAVDHALEMTWAQTPKEKGPFKSFLDLYENPWGKALSFVLPFPRFMFNSWKFFYDYSPAGFLKLLSSGERAAIAAGDTKALSRVIVGSGMLGAAWELRNSEYAGEKWYEIKVGDKRIDTRPWNPFSSYLFVAELAKRTTQGTLLKADAETLAKELTSGIFSGNFRAGAGLSILDSMVSAVLEGGENLEKASQHLREVAGQVAGGFLQPITTFRELYADYGRFLTENAKEEAKLRATKEEPFMAQIKRKIPGVSQTLPEQELPLSAKTPELESPTIGGIPISRQLTGISQQTRTPLEAEVNRLGLTRQEIQGRGTGDPTADRLILKYLGPLSERVLLPLIESPKYKGMDDFERRIVLVTALEALRQGAKAQATKEDPERFRTLRLHQMIPQRQRELLESRGKLPAGVMR